MTKEKKEPLMVLFLFLSKKNVKLGRLKQQKELTAPTLRKVFETIKNFFDNVNVD